MPSQPQLRRTGPTPVVAGLLGLLCSLAGLLLGAEPSSKSPHWAFQPLSHPAVPASSFRNPVDAFLHRNSTDAPSSLREADRRTLLRRLSFDLRGLPPTREEIAEFLADPAPDFFERWVDRFLASPAYAERWGRHWLDWVAYADSNGYFNADSDRPLAWKYRDYVVRSIQTDKPINRFIQEQIAGDELVGFAANGDLTREMLDPVVATHFWRNVPDGSGESDGNPLEVKVDRYTVLEGNVQLIGSAFLGLTLQCTRCHSHKFEPVTQQEYYGLQAILRPSFDPDRWLKPNERTVEVGTRREREVNHTNTAAIDRELKTVRAALDGLINPFRKQFVEERTAGLPHADQQELRKAVETKEGERTDAMRLLLKKHAALVNYKEEDLFQRFPSLATGLKSLRENERRLESERPAALEKVAVLFEVSTNLPTHRLLVRGNHAQEGEAIEPGVPRSITPSAIWNLDPPGAGPTSHRRLALARWLTTPDNPLPLRVLVNRVWNAHFGKGIVSSVDNLGLSGAKPSQPELIDWLAGAFVESGWSLKHLHRLLVTSATYRAAASDAAIELRRLDAESLRDAMLAVTGELDLTVGGPCVPFKMSADGQVILDEAKPGSHRRSLYLQHRRTMPVSILSTFDGPSHNPVCIQRVASTVAQQSLMMLNSEFIRVRSQAFARRLESSAGLPPQGEGALSEWATRAFGVAAELAYSRPATSEETDAAREFVLSQRSVHAGKSDASHQVVVDLCQMILASNAFLYVD